MCVETNIPKKTGLPGSHKQKKAWSTREKSHIAPKNDKSLSFCVHRQCLENCLYPEIWQNHLLNLPNRHKNLIGQNRRIWLGLFRKIKKAKGVWKKAKNYTLDLKKTNWQHCKNSEQWMLALCPGSFSLHHKGIENESDNVFPRHRGKCEVYSESMTNPSCSSIQFFVWNATTSR